MRTGQVAGQIPANSQNNLFRRCQQKVGKETRDGVESILRDARLFRKGLERFWFQITELVLNTVQGRDEHR